MILLTNGDSWTQGDSPAQTLNWKAKKTLDWYDIIPNFGRVNVKTQKDKWYKFYDSQVWPKVLGEKLGWETWNCGKSGISNDRIFRTTINSIEYLESLGKKDLFVVIGLSSVLRYETWNEYSPNHWEDKRVTAEEFIDVDKCSDGLIYKTIINIINLQNFCKSKNIPYLIFSAFDDMDKDLKTSKLYNYIDLKNIYNDNFKGHFKEYILDKHNLPSWNIKPYFVGSHPTDISHIEWGNHLYDYILKNKII
jgi:hypothetical protein